MSRVNNGYFSQVNKLLFHCKQCPSVQNNKNHWSNFFLFKKMLSLILQKKYSSVSYYYYNTTTTSFYTILLVFIAFLQGSLIWLKMSADLSKTQNLFIYYIIYTTITKLLWLALYKVRNTKLDIFLYIYYIISF